MNGRFTLNRLIRERERERERVTTPGEMERWYDKKWGNLRLDSDDEEDEEVMDQYDLERKIISGDTATVDELKRDGNEAFERGDYKASDGYYTQAIVKIEKKRKHRDETEAKISPLVVPPEVIDQMDETNKESLMELQRDMAEEAAAKKNPDLLHVLYNNRSNARLKLRRYDAAVKDARSAQKNMKGWFKPYYREGVACLEGGRYSEAVKAFRTGLRLAPKNKAMKKKLEEAFFAEFRGGRKGKDVKTEATRAFKNALGEAEKSWKSDRKKRLERQRKIETRKKKFEIMIEKEKQRKTKEKKILMEATAKETYSHADGRVTIELLESDEEEEEEEEEKKIRKIENVSDEEEEVEEEELTSSTNSISVELVNIKTGKNFGSVKMDVELNVSPELDKEVKIQKIENVSDEEEEEEEEETKIQKNVMTDDENMSEESSSSSKESKRSQAVKGGFLRRHMKRKQENKKEEVKQNPSTDMNIINLTDIIAALAWAPKSGGDIGNTAEVLCYEVVRKERRGGRDLLLFLDHDRKDTITPAKSYDTTAPSERASQVLFCRVLSMCESQPINTGAILAIHALVSGVLDGKMRELRHMGVPVVDYGLIQGTVRGVERLVLVMDWKRNENSPEKWRTYEQNPDVHEWIYIKLRDGSTWFLDLTAEQFGETPLLVPASPKVVHSVPSNNAYAPANAPSNISSPILFCPSESAKNRYIPSASIDKSEISKRTRIAERTSDMALKKIVQAASRPDASQLDLARYVGTAIIRIYRHSFRRKLEKHFISS